MYSLHSFEMKRYHLFKEARFEFKPGISFVAGANYSGKSLLMSAFPTMLDLIYDRSGLDKPPKNSFLHLSYSKDETPIEYAIATGASSKYEIGIGSTDMKPHRKKDAEAELLKNWTIPQALFNSTVFLKTSDHPLTTGTPGTRSTWLSEALDMTAVYDAYKVEVDNKLMELGHNAASAKTLNDQLNKLLAQAPDSSISKERAKKAQRILRKHRKIMADIPGQISQLQNAIKLIEAIDELPEVTDKSASYYQKKIDALREEEKELLRVSDKLEEVREAQEYNKRLREKHAKIIEAFPGVGVEIAFGDADIKWRKKVDDAEAEVEAYISKRDAYNEQADIRQELKDAEESPHRVITNDLAEAENLLSALVYREAMRADRIEALEGVDSKATECPTCGSPLTKEHRKKELKRLTVEARDLPKEIRNAKREVRYWKLKGIKLLPKPKKPEFSSADLDEWKAYADAIERFLAISEKFKQVPKVKVDNVEADLRAVQKKLKRYDYLHQAAHNLASYRRMLPAEIAEFSIDQLATALVTYQKRLTDLQERSEKSSAIIRKYTEIESKYETQRKLVSQHRSSVNNLKGDIAELDKVLEDYEAWKALHLAFGNSGVRLYQLRESAAVLSATLTELSGLFFNTTYRFNIEVAPHKLNVMVERNGREGSLKTLSGAESRCWNLLCAMALMRILPSHMRCDTIFLDEIEANMDKISRDRYTLDVLPELQQLVPKIVVISPLIGGELQLNPNHDYRIIKSRQKGEWVSELVSA